MDEEVRGGVGWGRLGACLCFFDRIIGVGEVNSARPGFSDAPDNTIHNIAI